MLVLILKDLLLSKKMLPLVAVYGFFMIIMFSGALDNGGAAYAAVTAAVGYILMTRAAYYEDLNKSELMIMSLPVRRSQVVFSKYLSVMVFFILGAFSYGIAAAIITLAKLPLNVPPITVEILAGAATGLLLLVSLSIPLLFKFGYIKSRIINMFLFFGAFFIPLIVSKNNNGVPLISSLISYLKKQPDFIAVAYMLGFAFLITIVSIIASLKIYKNKEF